MEPENRLRARVLQHAFLDHLRRAAGFAGRHAFLCRLEDELDGSRKRRLHRGQNGRDAQLHGGVDVVSACVHDADLLSEIGRPHLRRVGQVGLLGNRERIHVRAHGHHRPGQPSLEQRDDPVVRDAGLHLEAQLAEIVGDQRRGLLLAVRQLRVLVNLVADLGDRRRHLRRLLIDPRQRILHGERGHEERNRQNHPAIIRRTRARSRGARRLPAGGSRHHPRRGDGLQALAQERPIDRRGVLEDAGADRLQEAAVLRERGAVIGGERQPAPRGA